VTSPLPSLSQSSIARPPVSESERSCAREPAQISPGALDRACAEIFRNWRRFKPESEARAEADAFRRRCEAMAALNHLTEAELDATLEIVAEEIQ
jgi:hypothetical protein